MFESSSNRVSLVNQSSSLVWYKAIFSFDLQAFQEWTYKLKDNLIPWEIDFHFHNIQHRVYIQLWGIKVWVSDLVRERKSYLFHQQLSHDHSLCNKWIVISLIVLRCKNCVLCILQSCYQCCSPNLLHHLYLCLADSSNWLRNPSKTLKCERASFELHCSLYFPRSEASMSDDDLSFPGETF